MEEKFETEKLSSTNAERVLTSLQAVLHKIEILEVIPELCDRILARDINLETVLGEETSSALVHLALLRRNWEKSENENSVRRRVSDGESVGVCGDLREFSGSDSVSPWSSRVSRKKGRARHGAEEIPLESKAVQELKYFPSQSGINLTKKESPDLHAGNRNSSEQSEETKIGGRGDVLEGRQTSKNIEEAVALLRNDSSAFLRDVINASVTNAQATNKHSDVDNLHGNIEGNNLESAGGAEEQIDVSDMSHSVSTRSNNIMQLIRQALNSKYGDHTRRCIQDKDTKALLCILSLLDPQHCLTVTETANPIKGTKSNNTELPSQTRQTSLNSSFPNKSPPHTDIFPNQEHLHSPHPSGLTNNLLHDDEHEYEQKLEFEDSQSMSSPSFDDGDDQQCTQLSEGKPIISSAELRRQKLLIRKSESLGQSVDRILETIEEVEYLEHDNSNHFPQISSSRNDSESTPNYLRDYLNQESKTDSQVDERSNDSEDSYSLRNQIDIVTTQEDFPTNPSSNSNSENQTSPPSYSPAKPNDENEREMQMTSEMLNKDSLSDSMAEYFGQLDNLTDQNTETNGTEKSVSKSMSINFISDDNTTSSTTGEPKKWFKDIASEFVSKESLGNHLREIFRSVFNDILFNIPAIEFIKRIKTERENKEKFIETNGNLDLSITEQRNGANESLQCSEGLVELKKLVVQLDALMRSRLLASFEEEQTHIKYCRDLWIKEQRAIRKTQGVKKQLDTAASCWKPKLALLDAEIEGLQDELNALPENSLHWVKMEIMEGLKTNLTLRKMHINKLELTMERMGNVQNSYDSLRESNFVAENKFRQRQHNMEKELENIILKYDVEIAARQQLLDSLDVEEEVLHKEIQIHDDRFKDIDDRYLDMRAAKRLKEIMKGIETANSFKKTWAARRIQEAWRRYKIMKLKKKKRKGLKKKSSRANLKKGSPAATEAVKKDPMVKSKSSDSISSPDNLRSRSQSVVSNSKTGNHNSKKGTQPKSNK